MNKIILPFLSLFLLSCSSPSNFKSEESFEKIDIYNAEKGIYKVEDDVYLKGMQLFIGKNKEGLDTFDTVYVYCDEDGNILKEEPIKRKRM